MRALQHHDLMVLFLGLGTLLFLGRVLAELARKLNQPLVLGEILAGVLLGPTVLGALAPQASKLLFPAEGAPALVLDGLAKVAIALFLLVAGMEIDLSILFRQGRTALRVGLMGMLAPFAVGYAAAVLAPQLLGAGPAADQQTFALFFATALSISALPVIAKTLMDLHLYRTDFGMIVMSAAVFNDLLGWIIFALILGMLGTGAVTTLGVGATVLLTLGFVLLMLTLVRWTIHRCLPWVLAHTAWPGGVLAFALALTFFSAAFSEFIGLHAIFGAFLMGVALGDSSHLREHTRTTIRDFISFVFAPIFFCTIGLRVDFIANFEPTLVYFVMAVACLGKVVGCGLGARWSGMAARESWAIGFALNARGSMEIILGLLALQYGLITEPMFVALVIMALATSLLSGPAIQRLLGRKNKRPFTSWLGARGFHGTLKGSDRLSAIAELTQTLAPGLGIDAATAIEAVWKREQLAPTGIGHGLAVPHARLDGLSAPVVCFGISREGIDFDAPDGKPAQLLFLILSGHKDGGAQLEVLADIARTLQNEELRERLLGARTYTEFLAHIRTARGNAP